MSSNPECTKCNSVIYHGEVLCSEHAKELQERITQLEEYLLKYGHHSSTCSRHFGPECYCGWEEIHKELTKNIKKLLKTHYIVEQ